ncbi:Developmental regulator, ULTRAPETALA [Heracleum sosnowskyi]|uniref:Developmental regulator, ULTRAPETALA n=1 Tax=Heracleum sosnowskyi TaxID=360622 RepID=A0AAD8MXB3_9APIA|nr:Developmental regulator, ULTRAPETALA [Heracleum sosnowskyi]
MEKSAKEIGSGGASMFNEEDTKEIDGLRVCEDHVEVTCGCTSHQYGDAVGTLRVFPNGDLEINCECTPGCDEDKLTPAAFEKHSGRETARKWKNNIWVISDGEKVPLVKTVLLKYYNQTTKHSNGRSQNIRGHRDEFLPCTKCGKMRRFRLHKKEECRVYHDALANANWKCSDAPNERAACGDEEERASRRVYRGCSRSQTCRGCTSCVCFGCETCRFSDCSCQTCNDFTKNAKSQCP